MSKQSAIDLHFFCSMHTAQSIVHTLYNLNVSNKKVNKIQEEKTLKKNIIQFAIGENRIRNIEMKNDISFFILISFFVHCIFRKICFSLPRQQYYF